MVFACNSTNEPLFKSFVNESFADLTISEVQSLETPFQSVFNTPSSGRVTTGFADLAEIFNKLADIFPDADILGAETETERGLTVWSIKIIMPNGGLVKFKFVQELGLIIKMKGKSGPFDYEIDPGGDFIPFSAAMALAIETVGGEVHAWGLQLEENNQWEYGFQMVNGDKRYEVEIKGFAKEVIDVKEKTPEQDKNNDGVDEGKDESENGKDEEANVDLPANVLDFAMGLFKGTVSHSEFHEGDMHNYWKAYIENEAGSVVKIKIIDDPLSLYKIGGEHGPFDYEIVPGMELLSLQTVLEDVFRETEGGDLTEWALEQDDNDAGEVFWVYQFHVKRELVDYEIKMNAATGEFLKFEVHD